MIGDAGYAIAFPSRDVFSLGLCASIYDNFSEFRSVFDNASDYFSEDLHRFSYIDTISRPDLHMICLLTHCYGIYKVISKYMRLPLAAIGFSQGEFTAAAAANCIELPNILKLVYELESLVNNDEYLKQGSMVRVVHLDRQKLIECCKQVDSESSFVKLGIYLSNDQNIISGEKEHVDRVCKLAKHNGARWIIPLTDNGAFHSPLCMNIMHKAEYYFDKYHFKDAEFPVYSCVDGSGAINGAKIRERLSKQIGNPILWDKIINDLSKKNVSHILELGPGCTVSGNSRIICPDISYSWMNNCQDIENWLENNEALQ